jgi:hypothetical protein
MLRRGSLCDSLPTVHDYIANPLSYCGRYLMLPKAQYNPSRGAQVLGGLPISHDITVQLRPPPSRVFFWAARMVGTAVPEAPIKEDSDLVFGEGDINAPPRHARHGEVDAVAQPSPMKDLSNGQLLGCVTARLSAHAVRNGRRRGHEGVHAPSIPSASQQPKRAHRSA